ncbi:helix-turn-helix domain-containing protein [Candidatus Berkelbacteria bacterium]|nr:helix-turn-helix domain-containing protein [Candidatus Berkelbacteria bacterium]
MGYAGKAYERSLAIKLRLEGLSVAAIQKRLGVSKSSVSLWTREVQLTTEQKKKLYLNERTGRLRGSIIAAENKRLRRAEEEHSLYSAGKSELGMLTNRDKFIAGVALYFAEGDKTGYSVAFSNSDPRSIVFMMDWFRIFLKVPENKFRGYLYIHDDQNIPLAKDFWSKIANIPLMQFTKVYIVPNNKKRFRRRIHSYGVFRISISDVRYLRRIKGWIAGILGDTITDGLSFRGSSMVEQVAVK